MDLTTYSEASLFLRDNQAALEAEEARNHLLLGICLRLARSPGEQVDPPYLAAVADDSGPAIAAVMTPPHKLVLAALRAASPQACELVAQDLHGRRWSVPGVLAHAELAGEFAAAWTRVSGQVHRAAARERAFMLTRVRHPRYSAGRLRVAAAADVDLAARWVAAFQEEAMAKGMAPEEARSTVERRIGEQGYYLWEDGEPVSLAAWTRPTAHGIAIGPVYTPPERRRQGYASSCVAALSQLLLDAGYQFCSLNTDLANPTSNHIYQEIGYAPVCDLHNYVFEGAGDCARGDRA